MTSSYGCVTVHASRELNVIHALRTLMTAMPRAAGMIDRVTKCCKSSANIQLSSGMHPVHDGDLRMLAIDSGLKLLFVAARASDLYTADQRRHCSRQWQWWQSLPKCSEQWKSLCTNYIKGSVATRHVLLSQIVRRMGQWKIVYQSVNTYQRYRQKSLVACFLTHGVWHCRLWAPMELLPLAE